MKTVRETLAQMYWNMIYRCYEPRHKSFHRYGGRGIGVCDEWRDDGKEKFIAWALANGWQRALQLDRRDNDADYSPANCRFVGRREQRANVSPSDLPSAGQRRRYKDEAEREKTSAGVARSWTESSRREKQTAGMKRAWSDPDYLAKAAERQKARWADPEWRMRTSEAIKRAKKKGDDDATG
jgi:hypothetical protein